MLEKANATAKLIINHTTAQFRHLPGYIRAKIKRNEQSAQVGRYSSENKE
jgi:hypothetical protein